MSTASTARNDLCTSPDCREPGADVLPLLEASSAEIGAAFARGLDEVHAIRALTRELADALTAMLSVEFGVGRDAPSLQGQVAGNLGDTAQTIDALLEVLEPSELMALQRRVRAGLSEVQRNSLELRSASTLARIICADHQIWTNQFEVFIGGLKDRSEELRTLSAQAVTTLADTAHEGLVARDALGEVSQSFHATTRDLSAGRDVLDVLEARHWAHIDVIRADGEQLSDEIQAAIRRLVGCLQFPDTFAQRTAHVVAMLTGLDDRPAAERAALQRLAAAQVADMVVALEDVVGSAQTALRAIRTTMERRAEPDRDDPSLRWIAAQREANAKTSGAVVTAGHRLRSVERAVAGMRSAVGDVQSGLRSTTALNARLQMTSNNVAIAADRAGEAGRALTILAQTVRTITGNIAAIVETLNAGLGALGAISERLEDAALPDRLAGLEALRTQAADQAHTLSEALARFEAPLLDVAHKAAQVDQVAGAAMAAFERTVQAAAALQRFAGELCAKAEDVPADGSSLGWVWQSYTMESERDVHRALFDVAEEDGSDDGDDLLDDFML